MTQKHTVLLVSLFHPELVRGGAQQICYELFEGLKEDPDFRPILLASIDSNYPALYKSGARITGFDGRDDEFLFLSRDYDHWWHRLSDPLLIETYVDFLAQIQPDIVHFHHFLTYGVELISLTRRVLPEAKLVFTFHEFMAICNARGHMFRPFDKSLCRSASQVRCHQCFPERSPEDFFVRKLWLQSHLASVDAFTCPSRFMLDHYADWGIEREKLFYVTNGQRDYAVVAGAIGPTRELPREKPNRFGFFGQLIDAKGVHIILRAVNLLRNEGFTDFAVEINGSNLNYASAEVRDEIEKFMASEAERPAAERIVWFNGSYEIQELRARMSRVDWCIVSSMWWEAFALVISEAWMFGKPVICSNVGAMADRVKDEVDGLHFEMGDPGALARTIKRAATEPGLWARLVPALPKPPSRAEMVEGFRQIYGVDHTAEGAEIVIEMARPSRERTARRVAVVENASGATDPIGVAGPASETAAATDGEGTVDATAVRSGADPDAVTDAAAPTQQNGPRQRRKSGGGRRKATANTVAGKEAVWNE